jgi:MmgE/PrpD N-terminal domain
MTHHVTQQLAEFVVSTSLSHMPDEVVDRAKYFVLDYLGVALRGSLVDSSAAMRAFVDHFAPPGNATIIGCDQGAHPAYAALANGAAAHCIEMDDTHQEGSIHLGAPVISAIIAASEMQPVGGEEFLAAVVLGYEVAARLARAGRCWGLCRRRHLLNLNVHVGIPALEDGTQLPVERLHARLQQQMRTEFGPLHLLFFTESFAHHLLDRGLHETRRDRLAVAISLPIMWYQVRL